ncbi:DUF2917 domain-containing protein [Hydrogenophaga sp.]|uniref:DUF2917 domain-containing protein n=1 Tax=Hydrogenophaga sp. TaxID=1904254 RepID=UPI003F70B4CD
MNISITKSIPITRDECIRQMTLQKGALVSVMKPAALTVECLRGLVWITHDNEPHDVILTPGQMHLAQSDARMIVQGLSDSDMRIHHRRERNRVAFLGRFRWWRLILSRSAATPLAAGPRVA